MMYTLCWIFLRLPRPIRHWAARHVPKETFTQGEHMTPHVGDGAGHGHGRKEHPMHKAMRSKAIGKIKKHSDVEGRVRAFLDNEVEDFETMLAGASDPAVTKEQILVEVRQAIEDRKGDIDEIVPFLATGKVQE